MIKLLLSLMSLVNFAYAEYIPTDNDREFKKICVNVVNGNTPQDSFSLGMIAGYIDMAYIAHAVYETETVSDRNKGEMLKFICEKTLQSDYKEIGFASILRINSLIYTKK